MYLFVVALHVLLSFLLILIIILQPGKGGDVGAAFGGGGGGSSVFGPRGPTTLLARATTLVAVGFMFTSITLAWYSRRGLTSNYDVDDEIQRLEDERRAKAEAEAAGDDAPSDEAPPAVEGGDAPPAEPAVDAPDAPGADDAPEEAEPPAE